MQKTTGWYMRLKLKSIPAWRWICVVIFLFSVCSVNLKFFILSSNVGDFSYVEFLILSLNDIYTICYVLLLILILLASDIYNPFASPYDDYIFLKFGSRTNWLKANLLCMFCICIMVLVIYIGITIILYGFSGFLFMPVNADYYKYFTAALGGYTPFSNLTFLISFLLCRLFFICVLMFCINIGCKKFPLGFVAALMISLLDVFLYDVLNIATPLYILPIEHTKTISSQIAALPPDRYIRDYYFISYLYWLVLIVGIIAIVWKMLKKHDFMCQEYKD